jgi:NAD(P)-dependent dehydrogenase (short-subunit alcohol dehydrogenase family)
MAHSLQDPRSQYPKPPFPEQKQTPPGDSFEVKPAPDYGESTYRGSGKLEGCAALITGADSGIGRAVALAYAREGADVLIAYLDEEEDARETERLVTDAGRKAVRVSGDITQEAHCQELVRRAVQEFGKLDILVNNAAYQMTRPSIAEVPAEEWDKIFRTNIYANFYLTKAAMEHLPPGGSIISTASIEAFKPEPILLAYAATKAAIVNFTKNFSAQAIEKGVRVNAVAPGPVWTPLIPSTMPQDQVTEFGKQSPMQRPAQPAELAPAYVFLASQEAGYITGQVIGVTGGSPIN